MTALETPKLALFARFSISGSSRDTPLAAMDVMDNSAGIVKNSNIFCALHLLSPGGFIRIGSLSLMAFIDVIRALCILVREE